MYYKELKTRNLDLDIRIYICRYTSKPTDGKNGILCAECEIQQLRIMHLLSEPHNNLLIYSGAKIIFLVTFFTLFFPLASNDKLPSDHTEIWG